MLSYDIDLMTSVEERRQQTPQVEHCIRVCTATGCRMAHSDSIKTALTEEVSHQGKSDSCAVKGVGCMGLCSAGPLVSVNEGSTIYQGVTLDDVSEIVTSLGGEQATHLRRLDVPSFFEHQQRIVLENSGRIDPTNVEDYLMAGGYEALRKALDEMPPAEVVNEVAKSGLRGRGGAGFPTGQKWATVAKNVGKQKYVICNADEGDPGAFANRTVLESDPQRVLEGMAIAAYAIGATKGYIYIRAEYPLAIERLQIAIRQAEQVGLLGNRILDTPFSFSIDLRVGAGAYVCGEETALIASVEGKRGTPKIRPPYPAESGLWGMPTLINNVETFATIPPIIRNGGDWYAQFGTSTSKGTKVFSLTGQVVRSGVIEVPLGMTLREIIYEIGGGIPGGRDFKAVQTGGPTGGCVPKEYLDTPVDHASLVKLGSIRGTGGMIVMDETTCMVDVARYFMEFCKSESCGKCTPCRVGTAQMYDLLTLIASGQATLADLELLERLCTTTKLAALCGLGQSAPNPVLSTLRHFRREFLAHIDDHVCPAEVCEVSPVVEEAL